MLLSLAILTGGASVGIESNKEANYVKKLDRVLISNSLDSLTFLMHNLNGKKVALELTDQLTKRGVKVQTVEIRSPVKSEQEKKLKEAIATFQPIQILEIVPVKAESLGGNPTGYVIECSLYEANTMKAVWRSSIKYSIQVGYGLDASRLVDALVKKLDADGLLPAP